MLQKIKTYLTTLIRNKYLFGGLALFAVLGALAILLMNSVILPTWTRHGAQAVVPYVLDIPESEAQSILERANFDVEKLEKSKPSVAPGIVIDQYPSAETTVKPGRKVSIVVNTGVTETVEIPKVQDLSIVEARNRIMAAGLKVGASLPDPIPAEFKNVVTKVLPQSGTVVMRGSEVTLWYSTGRGSNIVTVPDVVGLTAGTAKQILLDSKLRAIVLNSSGAGPVADADSVLRQGSEPGSRVREGYTVRLYVKH